MGFLLFNTSMSKFIFITGGVVSSLGKGLGSAALGALLQARGHSVRLCKLDPYLNVDPGTMSPFQHGEVFVTDDGAETDLDLGHYERFTGVHANKEDSVSSGRVYMNVLEKERRGDYLGGTVQVIPHVTNEIKDFVTSKDGSADFILCEIGGTVGDIESLPFLESIRQVGNQFGREKVLYIHTTLVPYIPAAGELKTKPTQHSVKELMSVGIRPSILLCRSDREIPQDELRKISLFCNIDEEKVIPALDVKTIYEVPLSYHKVGLDTQVLDYFKMDNSGDLDLSVWEDVVSRVKDPEGEVTIAVVGKYTNLADAYKSLNEALVHGGIANNAKVHIKFVEASVFDSDNPNDHLQGVDGILVPGGFGERGSEGKIKAAQFARENKVPYFGICFGLQMAVLEAARNLAGITDATSTEFGEGEGTPLVGLMTEWAKGNELESRDGDTDLGGTMRLGAYPCVFDKDSKIAQVYGSEEIEERHRHRYEVNMNYREQLEACGFKFAGTSPDGRLPETCEYPDHPWFIGVQYHPELKSKPLDPHPLFVSFVEAALKQSRLV